VNPVSIRKRSQKSNHKPRLFRLRLPPGRTRNQFPGSSSPPLKTYETDDFNFAANLSCEGDLQDHPCEPAKEPDCLGLPGVLVATLASIAFGQVSRLLQICLATFSIMERTVTLPKYWQFACHEWFSLSKEIIPYTKATQEMAGVVCGLSLRKATFLHPNQDSRRNPNP
jgi:hypothetical protein